MSGLKIGEIYETYDLVEDPWSDQKGHPKREVRITDLKGGWVRYDLLLSSGGTSPSTSEEDIFKGIYKLKETHEKISIEN